MIKVKYVLAYLLMALFALSANLHAQSIGCKPALDTNSFSHWRKVSNPSLSNDGQYTLYTETGGTTPDVLVLRSNSSGWKTKISGITGVSSSVFSNDSRYIFYLKPSDSLGILDLRTKKTRYIHSVDGFTVPENGDWVAYQTKDKGPTMKLFNTQNGKTLNYPGVTSYQFNKQGTAIALQSGKDEVVTLSEVSLPSGNTITIETAKSISQVTFDPTGTRLACVVTEEQNNQTINSICCYQNGITRKLASGSLPGLVGFLVSNDQLRFSRNGDKILFRADTIPRDNVPIGAIKAISKLDIWNYKDHYMQASQHSSPDFYAQNGTEKTTYYLAINLDKSTIYQLNKQGENITGDLDAFENFVCVSAFKDQKFYYNKKPHPYYLVNAGTGQRRVLDANRTFNGQISPGEKYIVWFDADSAVYTSYEIASGIKRNLSEGVPAQLYFKDLYDGRPAHEYGILAWSDSGDAIFLKDSNDIWKTDLRGEMPAVDITGGLGKKDGVIFTGVNFESGPMLIHKTDLLILSAFNGASKDNGFYALNIGKNSPPEKLSMGPYAEYIQRTNFSTSFDQQPFSTMRPLRARNNNIYLVERRSAEASPNYVVTKDFKQFKSVSDVYPERNYNWVTSELLNWQLPDGRISQGVLYKPENFDPAKKYPMIFYYYEKQSNRLNEYEAPDWTGADINIPYFVSNGYLVFCPDIYYRLGYSGQCAVEALVSAAKSLSKLSYVDSNKMGIQGHSFGGFETNFIVTHSNIFAAACSASGMSNQIADYYQENGVNGPEFTELNQAGAAFGLGVTPYTHPELYSSNSPVLFADKATTPLLIVGGDHDLNVPITDDLEMFAAINRAGKKVWLLEYNEGNHIMYGNDAKDLTQRMKQFFDYYLKGATPPVWMTRGVPAATRSEDTGLEYDYSGAKP